MANELFRKEALERLSSPEQIDRLLVIIRVRGWIALLSVLLLTAGIFFWSVFGNIPIITPGIGIFFNPHDILTIQTQLSGTVQRIAVSEGDRVTQGMELMALSNSSLSLEYRDLQNRIAQEEREMAWEKEKSSARRKILSNLYRSNLYILNLKAKVIEESLKSQGKDPVFLSQLTQQQYDVQMQIQAEEGQIALLNEGLSEDPEKRSELLSLKEQLEILKERLAALDICAPADGTVLAINALLGTPVPADTTLLWLQRTAVEGERDEIFGFFPLEQGAVIVPGMKAFIQFASVNAESYGKMVGTVERVMPFAAAREGEVLKSIPSKQLRDFLTSTPASILVVIRPEIDTKTPSGYRWTTPQGPPDPIHRGSIASLSVVIENRKPISYLLPIGR